MTNGFGNVAYDRVFLLCNVIKLNILKVNIKICIVSFSFQMGWDFSVSSKRRAKISPNLCCKEGR